MKSLSTGALDRILKHGEKVPNLVVKIMSYSRVFTPSSKDEVGYVMTVTDGNRITSSVIASTFIQDKVTYKILSNHCVINITDYKIFQKKNNFSKPSFFIVIKRMKVVPTVKVNKEAETIQDKLCNIKKEIHNSETVSLNSLTNEKFIEGMETVSKQKKAGYCGCHTTVIQSIIENEPQSLTPVIKRFPDKSVLNKIQRKNLDNHNDSKNMCATPLSSLKENNNLKSNNKAHMFFIFLLLVGLAMLSTILYRMFLKVPNKPEFFNLENYV